MLKPETIASRSNPLLKDVRRATARGGLTAEGWCVAETPHLLEEALRSHAEVKAVLMAESARPAVETMVEAHTARLAGAKLVLLPDAVFQSVSATQTAQGVMALIEPPAWQFAQLVTANALVVVIDGIQDPGNAGTILRAGEAFGATGVIFLKGAVNPYNPKAVRASAGSLFRVPLVQGADPAQAQQALLDSGVRLLAAIPAAANGSGRSLSDADLTGPCALILGNEARGVSHELRPGAQSVSIPTSGVESLNAAVAAGILLYEARRQRELRP